MKHSFFNKAVVFTAFSAFLSSAILDCIRGNIHFIGRKFSHGDLFALALLIIATLLVSLRKWKITSVGALWFAFLVVLLISGTINNALLHGSYLNHFRTFGLSWAFYIVIYNTLKTPDSFEFFGRSAILSSCILLLFYWVGIKAGFVQVKSLEEVSRWKVFQNINVINLSLMLALLLGYWQSNLKNVFTLTVIVLLLVTIFFSLSRNGYVMAIMVVCGFFLDNVKKMSAQKTILVAALVSVAIAIPFSASKMLTKEEKDLLVYKLDDFSTEVIEERLIKININVVKNWFDEKPSVILLGDGISYQHSFLTHVLYVTGIIGFIVILGYYSNLFLIIQTKNYHRIERNSAIKWLSFFTIFSCLISDLATNTRSHNPSNAYLINIAMGFVVAFLHKDIKASRLSG